MGREKMIWLDSVLAVPIIGVRISPNFAEISEFQKRQHKFIDFLSRQEATTKENLQITGDNLWGCSISLLNSGFSFRVTPTDITGQFVYYIGRIEKPGSLPSPQSPIVLPYTEIIDRLSKYLANIFDSVRELREFKLEMIGIVANISGTRESLPPGVSRWLEHMAKPWGGLVKSEALLLSKISENADYHDQCHHALRFDETLPNAGINIMLDWQRVFKQPLALGEVASLSGNVELSKTDSLKYFQKFGEGDLNYG
jgi:hypothetical protein